MAKKLMGTVVGFVLLVLLVRRCNEPEVHHYVDPFPQGMETAFAEAGLPIRLTNVNDNPTGIDFDVGILLQIDAEVCPAQDQQCLEDLVEAQPWGFSVRPSSHPSPTRVVQFGIDGELVICTATGGPAEEFRIPFGERAFKEIEELEPGMWYFFLSCTD